MEGDFTNYGLSNYRLVAARSANTVRPKNKIIKTRVAKNNNRR
jgi:hypothetical protein